MNLVEELQKLEKLYQNGTLTAEEFTQAKTLLLSSLQRPSPDLSEIKFFFDKDSQLKKLDLELESERQIFLSKRKEILRPFMPWAVALGLVLGITAWYTVNGQDSQELLNQTESITSFSNLQYGFLSVTTLLLIVCIWLIILTINQVTELDSAYQTALKNHQTKRDQILNS